MNFEDVRVGQILVDRDGNEFEVMEIDRMDDDLPVCLKLVKHVKSFGVPENEFEVMEPSQGFEDTEFWVERKLSEEAKEDFEVPCIDVESLSLFVGEPKSPKSVDEVIKNVKHASLKLRILAHKAIPTTIEISNNPRLARKRKNFVISYTICLCYQHRKKCVN